MLLSKANLRVVQVASKDGFDRGLNGVRIERDGGTVAGNGKVLMAVSPCDEGRVHFPTAAVDLLEVPTDGLVVPVDSVERAIRHLPKDKRTQLQHVAVARVKDARRVGFTSVDARGDPTTNATLPKHEVYPDWKETVRKIAGEGAPVRVCLNRKDLIHLLQALEAACPDKGDYNPVFLEINTEGRGVLARCRNWTTGQHALGAITAFDTKGQWLERIKWEQGVLGMVKKLARKLVKKIRRV